MRSVGRESGAGVGLAICIPLSWSASKQWQAEACLSNEIFQNVAGGSHDRGRLCITKEALKTAAPSEGPAASERHCPRDDSKAGFRCFRFNAKYIHHCEWVAR